MLTDVAPGAYVLCWCRGVSCDMAETKISIGELQLQGPAHGQERSCARGQTCFLEGIFGVALQQNDSVMALSECGAGGAAVPGMPAGGLAKTSQTWTSKSDFAFSSGTLSCVSSKLSCRNDWREFVGAAAGIYRLCWCRPQALGQLESVSDGYLNDTQNDMTAVALEACSEGTSFRVDFGIITIKGTASSDHECTIGESCQLVTSGTGLSDGDRMMLKTGSCENLTSLHWLRDSGMSRPATGRGTEYDFGFLITTAVAGEYLKCWCKLDHTNCTSADDFQGHSGALTIKCPEGYIWLGECACGAGTRFGTNVHQSSGLRECIPCQEDHYCDEMHVMPVRCPAGRTTNLQVGSASIADCTCGAGSFAASGGLDCEPCPAGKFSGSFASSLDDCLECPLGTWSNTPGLGSESRCLSCPTGMHGMEAGQTSIALGCKQCPVGKYNEFARQKEENRCLECESLATWAPGSVSEDACIVPKISQVFRGVSGAPLKISLQGHNLGNDHFIEAKSATGVQVCSFY